MRAAIVGNPRRGDVTGVGVATKVPRQCRVEAIVDRASSSFDKRRTMAVYFVGCDEKAPAAGAAGAFPPRHGGIRAARYCFLVSAGFSVILGASALLASALGCVAPVGAAGAAAFGSTFLASSTF